MVIVVGTSGYTYMFTKLLMVLMNNSWSKMNKFIMVNYGNGGVISFSMGEEMVKKLVNGCRHVLQWAKKWWEQMLNTYLMFWLMKFGAMVETMFVILIIGSGQCYWPWWLSGQRLLMAGYSDESWYGFLLVSYHNDDIFGLCWLNDGEPMILIMVD